MSSLYSFFRHFLHYRSLPSCILLSLLSQSQSPSPSTKDLPIEKAILTSPPKVPPPISRTYPVMLQAEFIFKTQRGQLSRQYKYDFWSINDSVPGPMLRARVGDVLEVTVKNEDYESKVPHNIDFHAVMGPGGGSPLLNANVGQKKTARFMLHYPGVFIYHCSMAPMPLHIANGMYGLIVVEPEDGLEKVDREFYVMQSEFYYNEPTDSDEDVVECAYDKGLKEQPSLIVYNGREGALLDKGMLQASTGEKIRIFFGNAGPNLIANFHIIGAVLDKVYREGDLISPPARGVQTTMIPPGCATVVETRPLVPGVLTLSDHAIFRIDKGAVGFLNVIGEKRDDLYGSREEPEPCVGCKTHP